MHPVLFLHIPKTAGTSLRGVIEGLYPESRVCKSWLVDDLLKTPVWELTEMDFMAGHYPLSVLDWLPSRRYTKVTFLREPLARSISHFHHLQSTSSAYCHSNVEECDLDTFLHRPDGLFEMANMQTRYLGAENLDREYFIDRVQVNAESAETWINGSCIELAFQRACESLEQFDVIGIVERMNDSMLLLADQLVLSSQVTMGHANRATRVPSTLSDSALSCLREINRYDLKLYEEAGSLLNARIAELTSEQLEARYRSLFASAPALRSWHYTPKDGAYAYGWHGRENLPDGNWARWSASNEGLIDIALDYNMTYIVTFRVGFYTFEQLAHFRFTVNGEAIPLSSVRCDSFSENQRIYSGVIYAQSLDPNQPYLRLGWVVDTLVNPAQSFGETDNRDLGCYLWWCGVEAV